MIDNIKPTGSKHLPSQLPKDDSFERGYDKGVKLVSDIVIMMIDNKTPLHEIRRRMVEVRNET